MLHICNKYNYAHPVMAGLSGKETVVMLFYSIGGHGLTSFYKDYIN